MQQPPSNLESPDTERRERQKWTKKTNGWLAM
jgi:hypothetical protein